MKKYKTTKKHPKFKDTVFIYDENEKIYKSSFETGGIWTNQWTISEWLKKGWIKEVKEKVWYIAKIDNWKLKTLSKGYLTDEYINSIGFKSKKEALNYVLKEAKERFKGCNKANFKNKEIYTIIPDTIGIEFWTEARSKGHIIKCKTGKIEGIIQFGLWHQDKGWIAEPIKEPKLMLGNEEVEIYDNCISYKVESATKEQWMKLVEGIKIIKEYSVFQLPDIGLYWIKYPVTYSKLSNRYSIGCIENITIKQIENITKALEK